jgi:uncharacterized protein (DUF2141 family)
MGAGDNRTMPLRQGGYRFWSRPVMSSFIRLALPAAAGAALIAATPAGAVPVGPYASLCETGKPAVLVRVSGFKVVQGRVAIKLYASNPSTFLEKGKYLRKVEVPVARGGALDVCVPVPASGRYALSVRHEVGAKKSRSDGGGFSGNPPLSLLDVVLKRKPSLARVSFQVNGSPRLVPVVLNYLQGGSVRPVS